MKTSWVIISALCLMVGVRVSADTSSTTTSAGSVSATPQVSSKGTKYSGKKKAISRPTPKATAIPVATPSVNPTIQPNLSATQLPASTSKIFSDNMDLYDRVGAPGDLRQAVAVAIKTLGSSLLKHDRSIFLWMGKVTSGSDDIRQNAYVR